MVSEDNDGNDGYLTAHIDDNTFDVMKYNLSRSEY